ncbi:unnamed protein product [Leuciscus chuanchicus]
MDLRKWFTTTSTTVKTVMPSTTISDVDRPVTEAHPKDGRRASVTASSHNDDDTCPNDLGKDEPMQIRLNSYPLRLFGTRNRSFLHAWFQKRDWLEYSVKADAAFCYPCRKFSARSATQIKIGQPQSGTRLDPAFTTKGFHDWKHAVETNKGFNRHEMSKEHLTCYSMWKEKVSRIDKGKEISTLLYAEQIQRNRYYMSSLIDVVEFLVSNQLPLRGKIEAFDHMDEGGSGLFMSLLEFSIRKDPQLAEIVKTIPKNATYTSHEIQNELVAVMSSIVTDAIVKEIGDSWFTVKVDGTRDPTGMENISIVIRYFNEKTLEITERLLVMTIANSAAECVRNLRSEDEFCILCDTVTASTKDTPVSAKRRRQVNKNLSEYVVEETTGANIIDKVELRRLYFSALDHILGEIEVRFSERNSKFAAALAGLDPENETFLDVKSIKAIMDLTNSTIVETECIVAKQYISRIKEEESQQMMTTRRLLSEHHKVLEAMPSVLSALKLAVTFGASTAMCENSFSVLKNVFTDNRRAMNHTRKSQLVQLAFERDLTKKMRNEWKDLVLRKFNSSTRRLQLF